MWAGKAMQAVGNQSKPIGELLLMCYASGWETPQPGSGPLLALGRVHRREGAEVKQDRKYLKAKALLEVAMFDYQAQARKGVVYR